MISNHILKIVIEAEDRATAALERIESLMKRLGLVGTESFNKASGESSKFNESLLKANSPLGQIQKHLKSVGTMGVQSFNQLSVSERKTLLEMSSLSKEARDVMQRLNEVGVTGRNTWNQLSQSQQKALTGMNSLSQSTVKIMNNFSQFGMNATSAANALKQLKMDSTIITNLEQAKIKLSSLGVDINSVKGKILTLGAAAKESISGGFSGAVASAKNKLTSLKESIITANNSMKKLNQSSRTAGSGMGFLRSAASMTVGMVGYDLVNSIMEASRESINARGNFEAFGKRLGMTSDELKSFSQQCDNLQSTFKKVDMNAVGASALELGVKLGVPKSQMSSLTKMTAVMSSAFVKEGRTQEDAILAVSDAMDGQFRRLQEIGITQDKLKQNGWNGNLQDTESLMNAINKTMDDMGFTETASGIYTLDDAYQALTVSGGRLIGDILIPITPLITGMIDGIIKFIDFLKNLPDGAKIGLIAIAIGILAGVIFSSLIPAIITLVEGGIPALIAGILGVEIAALPLIAIVGAIVAAIVLVGGAIYELGKYFGWWKDLPSMFEAIQVGLTRMWSAFVNNPDVQGIIQGITDAFKWLGEVLTPVGQWFMSVLGVTQQAGEEFDIVRAIIELLGAAFHLLVQHLTNLYNAFMFIVGCIQNTISFFQWLYTTLINAPTYLSQFINGVNQWFSQLPSKVYAYISLTLVKLIIGLTNWVNSGRSKAKAMVNGIITFIKTLPGRVYSYIINTASRIISGVNRWVSNARSGASRVVSGVMGFISSIPGKVGAEFSKIPGRILSGLNSAVSAAGKWGHAVLNAAMNALGIHSPGYIQRNVVTEFENTTKQILNQVGSAKKAGAAFGESIVDGYDSNFSLDLKNQDLSKKTTVTVEQKLGLTLDFVNVPSNVSTSDLATLVNDDKFVTAIAENAKFQKADSLMKSRLDRKSNRSGGV